MLRTRPNVDESPPRFEDQTCDGAPESREKESPPKVLSSEESSEDEEAVGDGVVPGGQSPRLLPSSLLDRASAIAHHFSNSLRRSSLPQEDVRLLGCASPRPHAPETPETEMTVPSPGEEGFWDVNVGPGRRRRDSTLSKQDQLLISKIRRYYEKAGSQSPTFCLQRRESLSSIPAGLVRSSVSRINSTETTSWVAPPAPSEDQALPGSSECLDTLRLELRSTDDSGETQRSRPDDSEDRPSEEEEFIPSSKMIRIWQTMEQKITAQEENKISKLQEAPQSFRVSRFKVSHSKKVQNKDGPADSQDLQRAKVFEEELFVLRAPGHQEPTQTKPEAGGEQTKSKVLHLARQYSQKIKTAKPVVRQQSQGLLMCPEPLACVMEEVEKTESSGRRRSASLSAKVQTFTLSTEKPRLDLRNQAGPSSLSRPAGDRPPEDRLTSSLLCKEEVISTDQVQSGFMAQSSSSTEAFDWPDVQHLRSRYSSGGGGGGQRRVLSRARSMPERLLVRRHSSCSCLVLPEGPCLKVPSPGESGDGRDAEERRRRLQRAASLDLPLRGRTLAEARQQLASVSCGGYFVASETPRPDDPEHSVMVLEKVQEAVDTAEEEGEENYVQIRSPTSKEKISLMAVMDRCRVYQDSDESREEVTVRAHGARAPEQESRRREARQESSKQGRVKNLREKFQNMS